MKEDVGRICMPLSLSEIVQVIFDAIDEVNCQLPAGQRAEKTPDAVLMGEGGVLDSLALVNLSIAVEKRIEEKFGASLVLLNALSFSREENPFRTVGYLAQYIDGLLGRKEHET